MAREGDMRTVRITTLALGLFVSIAVVPALPASASDDNWNRCTQVKVALHPVYPARPTDFPRAISVSGPEPSCKPASGGLAARAVGR